jgi:hypothetical protein
MTMNTSEFAACIGMDWANEKHDFCLMTGENLKLEYGQIGHSPKLIDDWVLGLQKRFGGQPIAICIELNIGPIISCLQKYSFIKIFHVLPTALAKYRESFHPSGAKDDPTDAFLQLDYLLKHGDILREVTLDREDTRIIKLLSRDRRKIADKNADLINGLRARLKCYFPLVLELFNDLDTNVFCEFLKQWPDLISLKKAKSSSLIKFFKSHRSVNKALNERRIELIKQAQPITEDPGVIIPNRMYTLALVQQLHLQLKTVKEYEEEIAKRFEKHPDQHIFASLPSAGPALAPRLLAALGSDRSRFSSAEEVSAATGIAPVTKRSGKKTVIQWRIRCSRFERQTFVEWANQTRHSSFWANNYYEKQRDKGKSHQATLRALAFKWIRIVYSCWKHNKKYDESTYLLKRRERGNEYAMQKQ